MVSELFFVSVNWLYFVLSHWIEFRPVNVHVLYLSCFVVSRNWPCLCDKYIMYNMYIIMYVILCVHNMYIVVQWNLSL